jgi:hypothetical protein
MNEFDDTHAPTPEFRASLKRELERVYRAESQFGAPPGTRARRLGVAIGLTAGGVFTLTVGLVLGAATGYASAENLGARQRDALPPIATVSTQRQLSGLRLEAARAAYDSVRRAVDAGKATPAALRAAKDEVDAMQANLSRLELDASGAAPPPAPSGLSALPRPVRNAITALTCATVTARRQAAAPQQQGIRTVGVTPAVAKTSSTLGAVLGVRELSDGRVLVNDAGRRQIKIFDPSLDNAVVAQDSVAGTSKSYGSDPAAIVPYLGDSTLFTERASREVLLLDHNGQVARALAMPTYSDGMVPFPIPFPPPSAADEKGRLIANAGTAVRQGKLADSTWSVRADLETRQVEVVGAVHHGGAQMRSDPPQDGKRVVTMIVQPVPNEDSWSVLSDGTVAIVRGQDYHVDWLRPDGTKSATGKLPFDWKRLTDADKQKLLDSARVVWDSLMAIRNARANRPAPRSDDPSADGAQSGRARSNGGVAPPGQQGSIQRMEFVPLSEIPDYYPPIRERSSMADLDGNLWILPTTSAQSQQGELVYDVVNPKRGLFQRVRMPLGRSIVGFGKGGVIYLQSGDRANGFYLERVRIDVKSPK